LTSVGNNLILKSVSFEHIIALELASVKKSLMLKLTIVEQNLIMKLTNDKRILHGFGKCRKESETSIVNNLVLKFDKC
jgi:hypothetical protein